MDLAGVFSGETFKGREKRIACVYMGGQYFYILCTKSHLQSYQAFITPVWSKDVQKVKHIVNLAGWLGLGEVWKALEGGSIPAGLGWSAQPAAGEAPFHGSGHFHGVFISLLRRYPNYSPLPASREMGTDGPHCRNAEQLRQKLESSEWFLLLFIFLVL